MKATGIVRPVDELGRVTLPKSLRNHFDLKEKDFIEIFVDNQHIILRKYQPADIFTGEMDELIEYKGLKVSKKSIREMALMAGYLDEETLELTK